MVTKVIPRRDDQSASADGMGPHRVYSREDVMHEHAGKGGHNGAENR